MSGLIACALTACDRGAPSDAPDVTTKTGAVTGVVCDPNPNIPCVSTDNGRVLNNIKIINFFMSSDWDSDNAGTPFTKQAINDFTRQFVADAPQYFSWAKTDYQGAGTSVSFGGSFEATGFERVGCPTPSLGGVTDRVSIHAWLACLTAPSPIPVNVSDLGLNATVGNIPQPDDATVYVVYVPRGTDIIDKVSGVGIRTCDDYGAYHGFNATMKWEFGCGLNCNECAADFCSPFCCVCAPGCNPDLVHQTFAYAIIAANCAKDAAGTPNFDRLTELVTHELAEAAADPIAPTGWIDRTAATSIFPLVNATVLDNGEIADLCQTGKLGAANVALSDGLEVSTYWSTSAVACVPKPLVLAKCHDVTVPTAAGSCSAAASVDNGSSDPAGGAPTLTQSPPGPYGLGTTTVTLTVSSATSTSGTCTGRVTVVDRTPPVFTSVPGPVTAVEGTTPNIGTATATDLCPGSVTVTNNAPATFPIGVTTVTWTATDAAGNRTTAQQTVTITCAGGPGSCPDGHGCQTGGDCGSKACTGGVCVPPACAPRCNRGAPCGANADCGSQVCTASTCRASACSPHCLQGGICGDNSDCSSFVCTNNRCAPSNCSPNCNQNAPCGADSDCLARFCQNGLCQPPVCSPTCGTGALCNNSGDCRSHICNGSRCQ